MSSDNQDGVIWLLGCLIVLTLSGVFLSILVDKRFRFQRQLNSLQAKLNADGQAVLDLRNRIEASESEFTAAAAREGANLTKLEASKTSVQAISAQITSLKQRKEELIFGIPETTQGFRQYREDYRNHTWREAAGEKIEHLFLRTGRQFDSVVITKVTPAGLEISHAYGSARINSRDLSIAMQTRFQWFEENRK